MLPYPNFTNLVVYLKHYTYVNQLYKFIFFKFVHTISTTDPSLSKPFALKNLGVNPNFLAYTSIT